MSWRDVPVPVHMAGLPRDEAGRPVPRFVEWIDGKPDFRMMDARYLARAVNLGLCWTCGESLGRHKAFVIGPMCAVNRVSAEPPNHLDCATYAARACPFLANPGKERREVNKPEGYRPPPGLMIARNPGVTLVWVTRAYSLVAVDNGVLFDIGEPSGVAWWAEGRPAARAEVVASIESGLPALQELADEEGPDAVAELKSRLGSAMELVP